MTFSLYTATIPSMQQIVGAATALLDKGEAFCAASGVAPEALLTARLAEDMAPLTLR